MLERRLSECTILKLDLRNSPDDKSQEVIMQFRRSESVAEMFLSELPVANVSFNIRPIARDPSRFAFGNFDPLRSRYLILNVESGIELPTSVSDRLIPAGSLSSPVPFLSANLSINWPDCLSSGSACQIQRFIPGSVALTQHRLSETESSSSDVGNSYLQ